MTMLHRTEDVDLAAVGADLERDGFAVIPGVLSPDEVAYALDRLWAASAESQRRGIPAHNAQLDPNASNVRVFDLVDLDPLFGELLEHPVADGVATGLLGRDYIVSNFTANIARPGSRSMMIHSDQSFVAPEPWSSPWALNVIWCLHDVHRDNGATLYLPGSHRRSPGALRGPRRFHRGHGGPGVAHQRSERHRGRGPCTALRLLHEVLRASAVELHGIAAARGAAALFADHAVPPGSRRVLEHAVALAVSAGARW
jgi:hypothetical protein